jgi:hypothetical protein
MFIHQFASKKDWATDNADKNPDFIRLIRGSYSPDSSITIHHQLASFESVLFEILEARSKNYPRLLAGAPEIASRQIGKFPAQTINVLGRSKQPYSVCGRPLLTVAQRTQKLLVEIDVSEPKHTLYHRPDRLQLVQHKWKWVSSHMPAV